MVVDELEKKTVGMGQGAQADPSGATPDSRMPPTAWFSDRNDGWWAAVASAHWMNKSAAAVIASTGVTEPPLPLRTAPNLLLQTVIVPGEKTAEGRLVQAVTVPWFDIIELLRSDPSVAFQIPAYKWEEIIAGSYSRAGFDEVTLTPRSSDGGRDVIATIRGIGSVRVIDQVKAYKPGLLVTADDARALYGVLMLDGAAKGFLTTTSDFAPLLTKDVLLGPIIPSRIELINGKKLLARLDELARKGTT